MILRVTKFYGFCYSDEISEKDFFAKNFSVVVANREMNVSFSFVKGLDVALIKAQLLKFTFFEIEDQYLRNKMIAVLGEFSDIKRINITLDNVTRNVKKLKITTRGFVLSLI